MMGLINWAGCSFLLAGYVLLTLRDAAVGRRVAGIALSGIGAAMVGVWAMSVKAWPVFGMECVFTVVSIVQFVRIAKSERKVSQ